LIDFCVSSRPRAFAHRGFPTLGNQPTAKLLGGKQGGKNANGRHPCEKDRPRQNQEDTNVRTYKHSRPPRQDDRSTLALVTDLISNTENHGAWCLMGGFIEQALTTFAQKVAAADPDEITKATNGFVSGELWIACAQEVLAKYAEYRTDAAA
jgi:hypothetical protein